MLKHDVNDLLACDRERVCRNWVQWLQMTCSNLSEVQVASEKVVSSNLEDQPIASAGASRANVPVLTGMLKAQGPKKPGSSLLQS